jgi:hypothetical protein
MTNIVFVEDLTSLFEQLEILVKKSMPFSRKLDHHYRCHDFISKENTPTHFSLSRDEMHKNKYVSKKTVSRLYIPS